MIIIKKVLIFLCFFLVFNTLEVDSNSDKIIYYDDNIYDKKVYTLYFNNMNSIKLEGILDDINVLSYIIDGEKYYARNINELNNKILEDKTSYEKIYYEEFGYPIDGINVLCSIGEIIKLKNKTHIY